METIGTQSIGLGRVVRGGGGGAGGWCCACSETLICFETYLLKCLHLISDNTI